MLVTCLFDLNHRHPNGGFRTADEYLSMFSWIQRMSMPTLIFVDPHLVDRVKSQLSIDQSTKAVDQCIVVPLSVEQLPAWRRFKKQPSLTAANSKVSKYPEYSAVVTSKAHLLARAAAHPSVPEDTPMVWVDVGSAHIGSVSPKQYAHDVQWHLEQSVQQDRITAVLIFPTAPADYENLTEYLQAYWARIGGGLLIAPPNQVTWLEQTLDEYNSRITQQTQMRVLEEQLLSMITVEHPDRFRYVYGGHYAHTANMRVATSSLDSLISCFYKLRWLANRTADDEENMYSREGLRMLDYLLQSLRSGPEGTGVQYSPREVTAILIDGLRLTYRRNVALATRLGKVLHYAYCRKRSIRQLLKDDDDLADMLIELGIDLETDRSSDVLQSEDAELIWSVL